MTDGEATGGNTRRRKAAWLVGAMIVVVVAASIGWWVHSRDRVAVGDRFDGVTVFSGQLAEHDASVRLPFGVLRMTIGIGPEAGDHDHLVKAPHGATVVEVAWTSAPDNPPVWPAASAAERRDPGTELTLVSGGRRYPLDRRVSTADEGRSVLLVVQGDGTDARVEARFDGRVVRSVGGTPAPRIAQGDGFSACGDASDRVFSWVKCVLPVYRGDYVPGLGTAPAGKEWLVVAGASVTREERPVRVYGDDDQRAVYLPSGRPQVSVTIDGVAAKPRFAGPDEVVGDAVRLADRAWLLDADRASTVRLRYRLPTKLDRSQSDRPTAPTTREVDVSTSATYPAA